MLIRPTGTNLDADQRQVLTDAIAGTGGFLLVSDDLSTYGDAERDLVARFRSAQPRLDTTVDIVDPFATPVVVRSTDGANTLTIDWDAPTSQLDPPL